MKKITIYWYGQTGNSFFCAKVIESCAKRAGIEAELLPMNSSQMSCGTTDLIVLVFPVFNFKMPITVRDFIAKKLTATQNTPVYAIITMGGSVANTPFLLKHSLKKKNLFLRDWLLVRCDDSYIPLRKYFPFFQTHGRPDKTTATYLEKFWHEKILNGHSRLFAFFNPLSLFHWIGAISPDDAPKGFLGKRSWKKEACTYCDLCLTCCPTGAITEHQTDLICNETLCVGCCGCFNICPTNAWKLDRYGPEYYYKGLDIIPMAHALTPLE
jgi:ferredoxin/flavodoxin